MHSRVRLDIDRCGSSWQGELLNNFMPSDLLIFMLDLQWIQLRKLKNKTHYIFTYWVKQQTSKSPLQISKISVICGMI